MLVAVVPEQSDSQSQDFPGAKGKGKSAAGCLPAMCRVRGTVRPCSPTLPSRYQGKRAWLGNSTHNLNSIKAQPVGWEMLVQTSASSAMRNCERETTSSLDGL